MSGRTAIDPALDPSEFRARQRRVLDTVSGMFVFAMLGYLLPGTYVLVGVAFVILEGATPRIPGLALVPWISVFLYGLFVTRAAIVPLRRRPGRIEYLDDGGEFLAQRGGHAMVCATGFVYALLWAAVSALFVPAEGAWPVVGWSAVLALGTLTVASALRSIGVASDAWCTHPDDAYAELVEST